ncbi:CopD family protein [Aestuariivirga sp.]|uniref:CopD family protein n=1 Tax=Aestuariivirga sp. TaxID=2650926 RepID=UPI0039E3A20C
MLWLLRFASTALITLLAGRTIIGQLRPRSGRSLMLAAFLFMTAQLVWAGYVAAPDAGLLALEPLRLLAFDTWSGNVLAARLALTGLTVLLFVVRAPAGALLSALVLNLFLAPFSGHAATVVPPLPSMVLHGFHVASGACWIGGVCALALVRDRDDLLIRLRVFSPLALSLVGTAVVSGVVASLFQLGSWPAFLGTSYGRVLLVKTLVLLPLALACAAWLRWRVLNSAAMRPRLALGLEALAGLGMLALAAFMSQSVPGRHDDISWPLSFRLDPLLLWANGTVQWPIAWHLLAGLVLVAIAAAALALRRLPLAALMVMLGGGAIAIGGTALAVPAYPTTYATSPSAYAAGNLANARKVFRRECALCHGRAGHGDGQLMQMSGARAADLTQPHTADHTDGDLYWWITHGKPDTAMVGVADTTSEQDRWDLGKFVRLLTSSAQSITLSPEIVPMKPVIPAIGFDYTDADGDPASLSDLTGSKAVLLVLDQDQATDRLAELAQAGADFDKSGVVVIAATNGPVPPGILTVSSEVQDVLNTWAYYRRSLRNPDPDDGNPTVQHMEFLIDRFGYVRARWRADEGPLPPASKIIDEAEKLAKEPRIVLVSQGHHH